MKNSKETRRATLKDISQKTGYSVNTVSRALRSKDDIAEETIKLIKKTAKEMGYVSNTVASSLRSGYTNTIAILYGDIANPFFANMMKKIERFANAKGYFAYLANTEEDEGIEAKAIQQMINKNVDGFIICPTQHSLDNIKYLKKTGIPYVLIGRRCPEFESDYVIWDDERGGYLATKHLLSLGHTRILMLNGPLYISSAKERLTGYVRAHEEFGVKVIPDLIRQVSIISEEENKKVVSELIEGRIQYTAIFAFSDLIAWQVWSNLRKEGYDIPKDYSLIGFDNIQQEIALPFGMSSIKAEGGNTMPDFALQFLFDRIEGNISTKPLIQVIKTELFDGGTTLPVANHITSNNV